MSTPPATAAAPKPARERLQDLAWSVATSVISALLIAFALFVTGEVTGVNDRIFDGTCSTFDAMSAAERREILTDPKVRRDLDRDGDGDLCER